MSNPLFIIQNLYNRSFAPKISQAGMPERSNGVASRATGLVPTEVRILFPALNFLRKEILIKEPKETGFLKDKIF